MLSFPRGTEMFQFPRFPPTALCVQAAVTLHDECWVSPFGHLRIKAQSTAPRSFSQSLTSFIGSWRQGIHRWLLLAWKEQVISFIESDPKTALEKMLVLALQFSRSHRTSGAGRAAPRERRGTRPARRWGVRDNSLKTEEKTVTVVARVGERNESLDLRSLRRQPTSAPTGVSRTRIERMSIIEWRSTP